MIFQSEAPALEEIVVQKNHRDTASHASSLSSTTGGTGSTGVTRVNVTP